MSLPQRPSIYQINTYVWLFELSRQYGRPITLGDVPLAGWDTWRHGAPMLSG